MVFKQFYKTGQGLANEQVREWQTEICNKYLPKFSCIVMSSYFMKYDPS